MASIDKRYKVKRDKAKDDAAKPGEKKIADIVVYDTTFRASTIKGMKVKDSAGKDLGTVNELVVDLKDGKVRYGVLSSGGVAGIGAKLFAIPFHDFKLQQTADQKFFALNITPDKLRDAPAFDANRWPNMANPKWASEIDQFYGSMRTAERPAAQKK